MSDIKELGESLLQRAQTRNDRQYEKSRREAYKIALGEVGIGLANTMVKQKAAEFMTSEAVLSQKAKYRALVNQSTNISALNDDIIESKQSPEDYFFSGKYLPRMEEEFKAQYGETKVPQSYLPTLREKARELAKREAEAFSDALSIAQALPDYDTAMTEINSIVMPPTNVGSMFVNKIRGALSGRSQQDFKDEAIAKVEGLIKNDSYRAVFNNVVESDGIDEAVRFVKQLDSSGYTDKETITEKTEIMSNGKGGFTIFITPSIVDGSGNTTSGETRTKRLDAVQTPEEKAALIKGVVDTANLPEFSTKVLTPAAAALFNAELRDSGLSLTNIRTEEDFSKISGILTDYTSVATNLNDEFKNKAVIAAIEGGLSASEDLMQALARKYEDESEEDAAKRIQDTVSKIFNYSSWEGGFERDATLPTVRSSKVIDFNSYP